MLTATGSKSPSQASPLHTLPHGVRFLCPLSLRACPRRCHSCGLGQPGGSRRRVVVEAPPHPQALGCHPRLFVFPVIRQPARSSHVAVRSPAPPMTAALVKVLALLRRSPSLPASGSPQWVTAPTSPTCRHPSAVPPLVFMSPLALPLNLCPLLCFLPPNTWSSFSKCWLFRWTHECTSRQTC